MDVPGTVKNIFITWFADVQHWEVGRGSRLATLGHVKLPRSQAARCRVTLLPFWRCSFGGSKCHQLQIAGSTKKRLISPKFNYISAFLTKFNYKRACMIDVSAVSILTTSSSVSSANCLRLLCERRPPFCIQSLTNNDARRSGMSTTSRSA